MWQRNKLISRKKIVGECDRIFEKLLICPTKEIACKFCAMVIWFSSTVFTKKNWYTTNPTLISPIQKHLFDFSLLQLLKENSFFFSTFFKKIYTTYTINLISLIHSNFRKIIVKSSIWLKESKLLIENHAFGIRVKKSVNNLHKVCERIFLFFNLDQSGSSAKINWKCK